MKKCALLLIAINLFLVSQSQPESPWLISGNSGTIPGIHFLGTTDNKSLCFRVSNVYAGEIDSVKAKTFFGFGAGKSITTGFNNTAVGFKSLYSTTTGYRNTACGIYSLYSNTAGHENVAIGEWALWANTLGVSNSAIGNNALRNNIDGYYNTATGWNALTSNTTGSVNVANGYVALSANTTGSFNTANGSGALLLNSSGSYNTAAGLNALYSNGAASYNTGYGSYSLYYNGSGQYNTVVGYMAADSYDMGWNNTIIGANSDINRKGLYNCVALGESVTCTASSQARIGNSSTTSIGGYVGWSNISDGRFKKDVTQNVKGLEFIMKLQPITYHLDVSAISKQLNESRDKEVNEFNRKAIAEKEKIVFSGFVAQDVERVAKETGYDFSGVDKPKNENDFYGLRYAEFVVPLVKAVQEQQQMIEELKKQNADLQTRLTALEKNTAPNSLLLYNDRESMNVRPNPAHDMAFVNIVSSNASQALISVIDSKGALIKQQRATLIQGNNQLNIDMKQLAAGTYRVSAEWNNGQIKRTATIIRQ